jgi:hypothetical protein
MSNSGTEKEMGVFSRILGVFTAPGETFASLDKKPTWLVPFIIMIAAVTVMQVLTSDIAIRDRTQTVTARMEARGATPDQIENAQNSMQKGAKFGYVSAPIVILVMWLVMAGVLLFGGNIIMGGSSSFKKMLSLVSWSSLIGIVAMLVMTPLILSKQTTVGVTTSLAAFLTPPTPEAPPTALYRLLSKFDVFTVWQMILWTIGISVFYKFSVKKSALLIGGIWILWIVISVALGGLFSNFGM